MNDFVDEDSAPDQFVLEELLPVFLEVWEDIDQQLNAGESAVEDDGEEDGEEHLVHTVSGVEHK